MKLEVRPLSETLGAELVGVDVSQPIDAETFAAIRAAWLRWGVILLRDQRLDVASQTRFAGYFGALQQVRTVAGVHEHPAVMMVTNVELEGAKAILPEGEMQFHSDQCYYPNPAAATLLYAMEIPEQGGDTLFADCRAAYDTLPAETRERCEGARALFVYDYDANATQKSAASASDAPQHEHPVIRTHPETGRKSIFVNRLMTDHIVGWDREESAALLAQLYAHQEQPRFVIRHRWRPGDLVVWDNRCVLHARTDFDPTERRMLQRVTVEGDRPE
jgi:taurine dioxygenase